MSFSSGIRRHKQLSFLSCLTQGRGGETLYEELMNSRGLLTILGIPGTTEWRKALKKKA